MEIYLPIAEMSVNIFGILALGVMTGIISGMFGVGGGFLTTPLLMFIGIPPAVAVASSANQIVASSLSGFLAHWRKDNIDFRIGVLLLEGGMVGSLAGVWLFTVLKQYGQIDLVISLLYVTLLGSIGTIMAIESFRSLKQVQEQQLIPAAATRFPLLARLPMMRDFPRSKLRLSALLPLGIGLASGMIISLLGVGGGFLMIPAMIYVLGMPTSVVIGTSLFQIIFITASVTFLQAISTHTVDIILAVLLLLGSVVGVHMGMRMGSRLPAAKLRAMLAILVLAVALKLAWDLFAKPRDIYSITMVNEI
jgi:hypothetical protein